MHNDASDRRPGQTSGCSRDGRASLSGSPSSPGRSEGIGGGQYTAGMTYGLFGKFSARPGRRDDLITYLLKAAKLPQRVYEIAGPR